MSFTLAVSESSALPMDENPYRSPQTEGAGRGRFRVWKPLLVLAAIAAALFIARFMQVAELARQAVRRIRPTPC